MLKKITLQKPVKKRFQGNKMLGFVKIFASGVSKAYYLNV